MKLDDIKLGKWYLLRDGGIGRCDGRHSNKHVWIVIVGPIPRGKVLITPRNVERELTEDEIPKGKTT